MKIRHVYSTVPLVLAAGLFASSALAQTVSGDQGNDEAPRAAPGGAELQRDAEPIKPPRMSDEEATRAAPPGDPAKLLESFGTVSRSKSGEVSRDAPSEEVKRSLEGAEMDPAFSEDGDEASRQVIGPDDRVQVNSTTDYPFRTIGLLQSESANGQFGTCSATLIGPRTLLTAAHCLYNHDNGGWNVDFLFAPGLNGMENAPFGVVSWENAYIPQGYIDNYQGFYGSVVPWDIAVVILDQPVGDQLGWLGFGHVPTLGDFTANIVGYPGDKPGGTMWRATCNVNAAEVEEVNFYYDCDTYPGSSGSAVYEYDSATKNRTIVGVNIAETETFNIAIRLNETYFKWVLDHRK